MYILCLKGKEDEGAYAMANNRGDRVLLMFEEEDDAERYIGMLEAEDFAPLVAVEVDPDSMIDMCERSGYEFMIVSEDELVIPPSHNDL
jgi:hypothetical protein